MHPKPNRARSQGPARGQVRVGVLVIVAVLLCLAAAAFYYLRTNPPGGSLPQDSSSALSQSTRDLLKSLDEPVELRFYAVLDPATVPPSTRAFASRVETLLAQFEREGSGRVSVIQFGSDANAPANAAADGIRPFNIELGNACFLGITVVSGERTQALPHLESRWEHALEADLGRAIEQVTSAKSTTQGPPDPAPVDPSALAEVRRIIPDAGAVTLDQGRQRLRAVALQEFKEAVAEMETRIKQAEQELANAQSGGSESNRLAAAQKLDEAQSAQAERIKQIAARLQNQIAAFEKLKAASGAQ
jgi:ABC-type uncharacterized transport system involved in gliding motility auxiliary subunit